MQGVVDFVKSTEGIRKGLVWPIISLSMVVILVFIAIALGTYECGVCNISDCDCISRFISPCAVILAAMLWLLVVASAFFSGENRMLCPQVFHYFAQRLARVLPVIPMKWVYLSCLHMSYIVCVFSFAAIVGGGGRGGIYETRRPASRPIDRLRVYC